MFFFFQAEDGIRDDLVTGVQTCALPISAHEPAFVANGCADAIPHSCAAAGRNTLAAMNAKTRRDRMRMQSVFMLALYENLRKYRLMLYQEPETSSINTKGHEGVRECELWAIR